MRNESEKEHSFLILIHFSKMKDIEEALSSRSFLHLAQNPLELCKYMFTPEEQKHIFYRLEREILMDEVEKRIKSLPVPLKQLAEHIRLTSKTDDDRMRRFYVGACLNDPECQASLAQMYLGSNACGEDLDCEHFQNPTECKRWAELSAGQGNGHGMFILALYYDDFTNMGNEYMKHLHDAAEHGYKLAFDRLVRRYVKLENWNEAIKWLKIDFEIDKNSRTAEMISQCYSNLDDLENEYFWDKMQEDIVHRENRSHD